MTNKPWHVKNLEHANYARDLARYEADLARVSNRHGDRRNWIHQALRMRQIVRNEKLRIKRCEESAAL